MIEWFARNPVAANLLMAVIIMAGLFSGSRAIPLEVFPSFQLEQVKVTTILRGATPRSVEDSVTNRIEESIYSIEGIKKIQSQSSEGVSVVIAEVEEGYDKRDILNEIKLRVDSLNSLPSNSEKPIVSLLNANEGVVQVAVLGDVDERDLRRTADRVRTDLLSHPSITLVDLLGVPNYEISVEVAPATLDNFNISLADVTNAIRAGSRDVSAGNLRTISGDILVRTDGQAFSQAEFEAIPVITQLGNDPILLGDIATVNDGFEDLPLQTRFNGKPAVMMNVLRTGDQSAIEIADHVVSYIEEFNTYSTGEIRLEYWDDDSKVIKARLATLISSGLYGGLLVLLVLSLFLRPAVAFWVFLGVPVSFMGALIFMPLVDGTYNVISLFAFITVLGIVVDDAIVTGENIYRKMRDGTDSLEAAIIGTKEIAVPVTFGILTTVVAFYPMTDLGSNRIGFIAAQIPMVVIPVLLFSLIESKLVLPAHLSHIRPRDESKKTGPLSRMQLKVSRGLENAVARFYRPFLERCLNNKSITLATLIAVSAVIVTFSSTGHLKFTFFPRVEAENVSVFLKMPDTTGYEVTAKHIKSISRHVDTLKEKYKNPTTGESIIRHKFVTIGSSDNAIKPSVGQVNIELLGPEERGIDIKASELTLELKEMVGDIPGAESLGYIFELGRAGFPIDIELSGAPISEMETLGLELREQLKSYPGVYDIQDNFSGGKEELNIALTPRAEALGLDLADIASQVRGSVFGLEAQRIQRGREELRVMVRLPKENRSSIEDLTSLKIHIDANSDPVPLSDLATVTPLISPTTLYRLNRKAIINVRADIDKDRVNLPIVVNELREFIEQRKGNDPAFKYAFKGESEEQSEGNSGIQSGLVLVLIGIYALLAIPFKSYAQPLIVMSIIPFAVIGAMLGHIITGYDLSMLSIVGMMALLGVVVNDSLVLVDYINRQRASGVDTLNAILASGSARFRPVLLTSVTTFAGLTPLLLDNSTQSEFLKQMAISLGFGIVFATAITLIIVPINYLLGYQLKHWSLRSLRQLWARWLMFWNKENNELV